MFKQHIDPAQVIIMRHSPKEKEIREIFPWLMHENHEVFSAYQQSQSSLVEKVSPMYPTANDIRIPRSAHAAAFLELAAAAAGAGVVATDTGVFRRWRDDWTRGTRWHFG